MVVKHRQEPPTSRARPIPPKQIHGSVLVLDRTFHCLEEGVVLVGQGLGSFGCDLASLPQALFDLRPGCDEVVRSLIASVFLQKVDCTFI